MRCLEQFRRRYVEKEIIPPAVAMIIGTGTHKGVEVNLVHKIETGTLLPVDAVRDAARDGVNQAWEQGVRFEPEEIEKGIKAVKGEAVDKAVRLASLHHHDLAPVLQPTHVERSWSLELQGYPIDLVGRIDIQEGKASIRDTKTSGKTPAPDCAERSLQLKAYHLAVKVLDGTGPEIAALDYLIDNRVPKATTYFTSVSDEDYRALLARVEIICRAMEVGLFPPVEPTHWCCSLKWCGYASSCKYFVNKPSSISVPGLIQGGLYA
jgi:hypothetical protein